MLIVRLVKTRQGRLRLMIRYTGMRDWSLKSKRSPIIDANRPREVVIESIDSPAAAAAAAATRVT